MHPPTAIPNPAAAHRFILDTLGFSAVENSVLRTTFRLTGRRAFCYAKPSSGEQRADIYRVNADHPDELQQLDTRAPNPHARAVLIGCTEVALEWPRIPKPIRWMRLFEQLDQSMQASLQQRARRPSASNAA